MDADQLQKIATIAGNFCYGDGCIIQILLTPDFLGQSMRSLYKQQRQDEKSFFPHRYTSLI